MTTKPIKAIPLVDKESTPMVEKVVEKVVKKENTPMVEMVEKKNIPLVQQTNFDSLEINDLDTLFKIIKSPPNAVMKWNKKTNNYSLIENTADTLGNTDSLE